MNAHSNISRRAALFRSNRNQAVRIPKDMEFPEGVNEVVVRRVGKQIILTPANASWDDFFDEPGIDLGPRDQPPPQERDFF
ncbi:MAG: type II toxin-antitoxin system VapB family antitoxin [Novosphingobium sp.]